VGLCGEDLDGARSKETDVRWASIYETDLVKILYTQNGTLPIGTVRAGQPLRAECRTLVTQATDTRQAIRFQRWDEEEHGERG
jgi:hypothetical protein